MERIRARLITGAKNRDPGPGMAANGAGLDSPESRGRKQNADKSCHGENQMGWNCRDLSSQLFDVAADVLVGDTGLEPVTPTMSR